MVLSLLCACCCRLPLPLPPAASLDANQRQPYAQSKFLGISTGASRVVQKAYMSTKKMLGVPTIMGSPDFAGTASANPANLWYWHVISGSPDGNTQVVYANIEITYYVECSQRVKLSTS